MEISYKLHSTGRAATLKVFEGDVPRTLAERFCEKHDLLGREDWYAQDIHEKLQDLAKNGITEKHTTTLYRGLGLPMEAI